LAENNMLKLFAISILLALAGYGAGLTTTSTPNAVATLPTMQPITSATKVPAEAEAAELARLAVPITSPLLLQYRPTVPISLQGDMWMSIDGKSASGTLSMTMDSRSVGDAIRTTFLLDQKQVGTRVYRCEHQQPLLTTDVRRRRFVDRSRGRGDKPVLAAECSDIDHEVPLGFASRPLPGMIASP
jgi:hypothetical protein